MRYVLAALALMGGSAPAMAKVVFVNFAGATYHDHEYGSFTGSFWYDSDFGGCADNISDCDYHGAVHDFVYNDDYVSLSNPNQSSITIWGHNQEISFNFGWLHGESIFMYINLPVRIDTGKLPVSLPEMDYIDGEMGYFAPYSSGDGTDMQGWPGAFTLTSVPEPATWAMILTGFGLAGAAMRRRRNALTA